MLSTKLEILGKLSFLTTFLIAAYEDEIPKFHFVWYGLVVIINSYNNSYY